MICPQECPQYNSSNGMSATIDNRAE